MDAEVRPWPLPRGVGPFADLAAALYGAAVRVRGAAYDAGWLEIARAERPVISIGNLVAGGTGKTPLAIFLAGELARRGLHVAVLSRGYGAKDPPPPSEPLVVSERGGLRAPVERSGDEPQLIARRTKASVVVCPDRLAGAKAAVALGAQVLLLDDGFQHRRLARDLDLLVVDGGAPVGNGKLLPAGPLREPPASARRAGLIAVNRGGDGGSHSGGAQDALQVAPGTPRFSFRTVPEGGAEIRGLEVGLVCAIARPARFERTAADLGAAVVHRAFFKDHAWISRADLDRAASAARAAGAELLLTTEKDAVRLPAATELALPLLTLPVAVEVIDGAEHLRAALDRALAP